MVQYNILCDCCLCNRLGNEFFSAKKYDEAILHYTTAIKEDPENAVYYSNRR